MSITLRLLLPSRQQFSKTRLNPLITVRVWAFSSPFKKHQKLQENALKSNLPKRKTSKSFFHNVLTRFTNINDFFILSVCQNYCGKTFWRIHDAKLASSRILLQLLMAFWMGVKKLKWELRLVRLNAFLTLFSAWVAEQYDCLTYNSWELLRKVFELMNNKLLTAGCSSVTTNVRKDRARFLNLVGVLILPNFLIFCKKLSDQAKKRKCRRLYSLKK